MKESISQKINMQENVFLTFENNEYNENLEEKDIFSVNGEYLALSNSKSKISIYFSYLSHQNNYRNIIEYGQDNLINLSFYPFNEEILLSTHENNNINIWKIPKDENINIINNPIEIYNNHKSSVSLLSFNPVASDIICSIGKKGDINIWNISQNKSFNNFILEREQSCLEWNKNGALIGIGLDNKDIYLFDPRIKGENVLKSVNETKYNKLKFKWNSNEKFISFGCTSNNEHKVKFWDVRNLIRSTESYLLEKKSENELFPFIDTQLSIIYMFWKNENEIKLYNISDNLFKELSYYKLKNNCSNISIFNKCDLNYYKKEVERFALLDHLNNNINYLTFVSDNIDYNDNIHQLVESCKPSLSYEKWLNGVNSEPDKIEINSVKNNFLSQDINNSENKEELKDKIKILEKKIEKLEKQLKKEKKEKRNKNNDYEDILREKIIKDIEPKKNLYDEYILNSDILSEKTEKIRELNENGKIIGRVFLNNENKISYYELFENKRLNLINNANKNITFIHPP